MTKNLNKLDFTTSAYRLIKRYFPRSTVLALKGQLRLRRQIKVHFAHKYIAQWVRFVRHLTALSFLGAKQPRLKLCERLHYFQPSPFILKHSIELHS